MEKPQIRGDSVARKHFFTTGDMFGNPKYQRQSSRYSCNGTNKTLTCKGNELTFEEGEQNDDNTWTVETARDKSTGHYSPILKSLSGKYNHWKRTRQWSCRPWNNRRSSRYRGRFSFSISRKRARCQYARF